MTDPDLQERPVSDGEVDGLWRSLRAHVAHRLPVSDQAEDIVQETFLRLLEQPPKSKDHLPGWLRVVARRLIIERSRRARSREHRERAAAREESELSRDTNHEPGESHVLQLIAALRNPYSQVVRLRFVDGLEIAEIAEHLGRSQGTIRSQLKRGLDQLRVRLEAGRDDGRKGSRRKLGSLLPWPFARWRRPARLSPAAVRAVQIAGVIAASGMLLWFVGALRTGSAGHVEPVELAAVAPQPSEDLSARVDGARDASDRTRSRINDEGSSGELAQAPPMAHDVRGRVFDRLSELPIAAARIVATRTDDDSEKALVIATSDAEGRFAARVQLPAWIGAEHPDQAPTRLKLVDSSFAESGETLVLDSGGSGRIEGVVRDRRGSPVAGALVEIGEQDAQRTRDVHALLERRAPPTRLRTDDQGRFAGPLDERPTPRIRVAAEGHAPVLIAAAEVSAPLEIVLGPLPSEVCAPAQVEPEEVAVAEPASLTGRVVARHHLLGSGLDLRLDRGQAENTIYVKDEDDGRFRIRSDTPGPFTLYVEGGGAHGAWLAAQGSLAPGAELDLGEIELPVPGSLRVFAGLPSGQPAQIGTVVLFVLGRPVRLNARVETASVRFDRKAGRAELDRVWPGDYRLAVRGPWSRDVHADASVAPGRGAQVSVVLEEGCKLFVRAELARALHPDEQLEVLLGSPQGTSAVEDYEWRQEIVGNALRFNLGVAPDVEWIEIRSGGGLSTRHPLPPCKGAARGEVEFLVGEPTSR